MYNTYMLHILNIVHGHPTSRIWQEYHLWKISLEGVGVPLLLPGITAGAVTGPDMTGLSILET